ncbi:type I-E CRISPR-associated protein Cas7/Cse4/CasC [Filomicrobium sp.]|uniref:type I-E CRISPR-associated protein Cas7/Cse4/CasC n=1 Tax=Filomicrobium sp. TaxID=2024831 RepID=UPI002584626C|nr:type I-E CRISPR-associated protein Cas7/Cse4/CasC [Filomicrobium sp.]MCV0369520.1 type I-E CRISPR-associated protein Cas7/Cse4/CasC [Filomicrobium sp.]
MSRFIQIHALTVYAPSNLNRDDTGRPKTAKFGGVERLRISSQALKRAIRTSDAFKAHVKENRGDRTQRLGEEIRNYLLSKDVPTEKATEGARAIAAVFGKIKPEKDRNPTYIEQLAFISPEEREAALALADRLAAGDALPEKTNDLIPEVLRKADTATDIAMFGRMLADNPEYNREAAVQIAHAITTHRVEVEDDFYTAVDDLKKPSEDAGAGFIGELGFGSGVFYIYACVDRDLLEKNLCGDKSLAATAIAALIEGIATASPSGKQASFASRARASYLRVEKGDQQPRSLAAAFLKPVREEDMLKASIDRLEGEKTGLVTQMNEAYGACFDDARVMQFIAGEGDNTGSLPDLVTFAAGE